MSDTNADLEKASAGPEHDLNTQGPPAAQITDLMAEGAKGGDAKPAAAKARPQPDLDAQARMAAQQALAQDEAANAAARARLEGAVVPPRAPRRGRELALRLLLAANVLAMLVVASLPKSESPTPATTKPETPPAKHEAPATPTAPKTDDKYSAALMAASKNDYPRAISLLEELLTASPRMVPSAKVNVLLALAHYSQRMGNFEAAQGYERLVQSQNDSHSLPEDLVAMAKAAVASGDQESLRRIWARFLLQQRQVPTSLYRHVAEAYLQLGDSYRLQANTGAERERVRLLEEAALRLREQALQSTEKPVKAEAPGKEEKRK